MEIIKDLSVLNKIMTEARYLFASPDDKRLQMMDDILLKFKRQKALIAASARRCVNRAALARSLWSFLSRRWS
jgi:hypothetical protein